MLRQKFAAGVALAIAVVIGIQTNAIAFGKVKNRKTFKVRIENISAADGLATEGGAKYPFALSPGLFVVNHRKHYFFNEGDRADAALEAQAEDGNPEPLSKAYLTKVGGVFMGVFNKPVGSSVPAPILPGGAYEFSFTASEGMRFSLIAMYGQSNDLFYAPQRALDLFDANGNPLTGDITGSLVLWDAGTELNQAPGVGDEQAPRQKMANTGKAENGKVGMVKDMFTYPKTTEVLRVTITAE
ncbi:MAG TPA: spondin domain-containing protein [Pyrinomonadaceae bacterium]